jgi:hypothetical protein
MLKKIILFVTALSIITMQGRLSVLKLSADEVEAIANSVTTFQLSPEQSQRIEEFNQTKWASFKKRYPFLLNGSYRLKITNATTIEEVNALFKEIFDIQQGELTTLLTELESIVYLSPLDTATVEKDAYQFIRRLKEWQLAGEQNLTITECSAAMAETIRLASLTNRQHLHLSGLSLNVQSNGSNLQNYGNTQKN